MLWALLVAGGVAVVSMTIFAARLTRRSERTRDSVEFVPVVDPADPWAAWQPRSSFDELDRPRPRIWPLIGALTGVVIMGAGLAGARDTIWATAAAPTSGLGPVAEVTTQPDVVQVTVTDAPTPPPTPAPTIAPTPEPSSAPAAPVHTTAPVTSKTAAPTGTGPTVAATPSCSGGTLAMTYSATANGAGLSWIALYVDGAVAKGGPISGTSYNSSYSKPAAHGDHALEVSVQDKAGRTTRKQFQVHCA